jgi:hypothetical protein
MPSNSQHNKVISGVADQLGDVLENSEQSVYVYLDDVNKVCNRNFSSLLGYSSPKEWSEVEENFPDAFVSRRSQQTLVSTYQAAVTKFVGSTIEVAWKRKDGKEVDTTTILVPIVYDGHAMALHFIDEAKR